MLTNKNKNMFKFIRVFIVLVVLMTVGSFIFRGMLVFKSYNSGETLYEITINDGENSTSYITTEYVVQDQCVKFKDEFGIRKTVCGHYTINQYN